ncbi:sulfurtransferase complex subunit TusD [Vibrio profundum]|uniref:sulfurtransferase complex subunit TusD n=1 Tax=Vibrio profundum TaxID=2910247 RepID=UPI003D104F26
MNQKLTYTLLVTGSLYGSQSARNAYMFAKELLTQGHQLVSVFFYQDGVLNASAYSVPANDEFDLVSAWRQLEKDHAVRLETCVSAALRRGVVSEAESEQHKLDGQNFSAQFSQVGLGSLAEAMLTQDRVVEF